MNHIEELEKIPVSEWAKIWCSLNSWKIPELLSHIKPDWWDDEPSKEKGEKMYLFVMPLMKRITFVIGDKATSREWNRDMMTDEEHDFFYNNPYEEFVKKYRPREQ